MQRVLNFLAGLVSGAVVGATVALLLAPSSGSKTRNDIQGYLDQAEREIRQAAKDRRSELEQQLAALRGEIVSE